ncbi:hypothetical protein HD554DRAFT_2039390 [Boletus coccyginus]|nr:hypothetical protein HD554DRAFT_2039390 [Boletus coccyginus]
MSHFCHVMDTHHAPAMFAVVAATSTCPAISTETVHKLPQSPDALIGTHTRAVGCETNSKDRVVNARTLTIQRQVYFSGVGSLDQCIPSSVPEPKWHTIQEGTLTAMVTLFDVRWCDSL